MSSKTRHFDVSGGQRLALDLVPIPRLNGDGRRRSFRCRADCKENAAADVFSMELISKEALLLITLM